MSMGDGAGYGHAHAMDQPDRNPGDGSSCGGAHPLLDHVFCSRLPGHPGKHGAHVDSRSVDVVMEWDSGERAAERTG